MIRKKVLLSTFVAMSFLGCRKFAGTQLNADKPKEVKENLEAFGTTLQMIYTFPHFMGYRFALFNYATKITGGAAAFDFFHITDTIQ